MRLITLTFLALSTNIHAQGPPQPPNAPQSIHQNNTTTETGSLNNAAYRIDIPDHWNHALVVYYHGYSMSKVTFDATKPITPQAAPMLQRGYAVIQSGYSQTNWAVPEAAAETETLRKYFIQKHGQPKETILAGSSMGGGLVRLTLEQNPQPYLAGLDLCGSVLSAYESVQRRFAARAAFDYFFPTLLPPLDSKTPFAPTDDLNAKILAAITAKPDSAAAMRSITGLHTDAEVAAMILYFTYFIADLQHKAGGNPFDNRNYLYSGTATDYALNDGVHRYPADPAAQQWLVSRDAPTGRLTRPMLALHTLYDPVIPVTSLSLYSHQVEAAGFAPNLVQQYVHRDGHCTFSPAEIGRAFDELIAWSHNGPRPTPGLLP